jgi:hypothetical protein
MAYTLGVPDRQDTCIKTFEVIRMGKVFRNVSMIGCLALPFGLLGSERPQKEEKVDRELAKKIQKSVAKDDSLQASSRKIEVTVEHGTVTLKGEVQSDEESQAIQGKAESFVIQETPAEMVVELPDVKNQLVVTPNQLTVAGP